MKKTYLVLIIIIFTGNLSYGFDKLNIINEFLIFGDTSKFYFSPVASFNNDKLYLIFGSDNKYKMLCYNLNGEKIGQNKFDNNISKIRNIEFHKDTVTLKMFYGLKDTIRYYNYLYTNEFQTIEKINEKTYFNGYIESGTSDIPRISDSLYFVICSLKKDSMSQQRYHILVTDSNYKVGSILELESSNIDADVYNGGSPIYYLDNGHFTFNIDKSKNGTPFVRDTYTYEFDFTGKYYSKKLVENKIVYNGDTLIYKGLSIVKMKDFSQIIFCTLSDSTKVLNCLIKFAPNGDKKWIKPLPVANDTLIAVRMNYLEKSKKIILLGRFLQNGNKNDPYGSYFEIFDDDGNHLETYTWQRNIYLDCTVFNVIEGPDNHLLVITKNGDDSLVVSEIIPKYVSVKDDNSAIPNTVIYPNPASDYITLDGNNYTLKGIVEQEIIMIYDVFGKKVLTIEAIHELPLQIDVSSIYPGVYFLKLNNQPPVKFIKY